MDSNKQTKRHSVQHRHNLGVDCVESSLHIVGHVHFLVGGGFDRVVGCHRLGGCVLLGAVAQQVSRLHQSALELLENAKSECIHGCH